MLPLRGTEAQGSPDLPCMQTQAVLTPKSNAFSSRKGVLDGERVSCATLKSKMKTKTVFQPRGLLWAHTHTNRKSQNKGVQVQGSEKPSRSWNIKDGQGLGRWKEKQEVRIRGTEQETSDSSGAADSVAREEKVAEIQMGPRLREVWVTPHLAGTVT